MAEKLIKKKKEDFKKFVKSINRFTSISYVWKKMRVLRQGKYRIDWNKWQAKDRKQAIMKEIEK